MGKWDGGLVFEPRTNAIKPNTAELTDFQITVSDGVAPALANKGTRVTTTSVNDAPVIGGVSKSVMVNDNATVHPLATVTITDADWQEMLISVTVLNGTVRGDFTSASVAGWTRSTVGNNITYQRYFNPQANVGAAAEAAFRALVFQPRTNVPISTTETTSFSIFINDGMANVTNSTTSVITAGVAPRLAMVLAVSPAVFDSHAETFVIPSAKRPPSDRWSRFMRKPR